MTYDVFGVTLNLAQPSHVFYIACCVLQLHCAFHSFYLTTDW